MLLTSKITGSKKSFTHWTCPYCRIIIPDYRHSLNSIETRVLNHLVKTHYDIVSRQEIGEVKRQLKISYNLNS